MLSKSNLDDRTRIRAARFSSQNPLRVLHLYSGNLYGGIENLLTTLARFRAAAPSTSQHFGLHFEGRLSRQLREASVTPHMLGEVRARQPWSVLAARRSLSQWLARERFDVVVTHAPWVHAIDAAVVVARGVPIVAWIHDVPKGTRWFELWAKRTKPAFAICNSRFTQRSLAKLYRDVSSQVLHYPSPEPTERLTTEGVHALRASFGATERDVVILHASRMQPWKGHVRHLHALARLVHVPGWMAVFAGGAQQPDEAAYLAELRQLARALGISERVRFLGERSDVPVLMQAADIHCQPNAEPEPFGLVFVEALYAGLPIVTFDFGGPSEIVTPAVGLLAGSDSELVRNLERLLTEPELRRRLGSAGPARARELCSPARQIERIERTLQLVVTGQDVPQVLEHDGQL